LVLKWLSIIILANIIDKCRSYALKYKDEIKAEAEKEINKKFKWSFMSGGKTEAFSYNSALDSMESSGTRGGFLDTFIHYWNYGYDEIRNYAYPSNMTPKQVFSEFDAIIEKKELKTKFHVNEKEEKKKYGNKMYDFISFDDGWKWVMKEVNQCEFEQKWGGHCGTALKSNEHILSLREPSENKDYWKIWASFSISPDGILGYRSGTVEIKDDDGSIKKREGNRKPEEFTHKYIYRLMMDDRVKGINLRKYSYSDDIQTEDFEGKMKENLEDRFDIENVESGDYHQWLWISDTIAYPEPEDATAVEYAKETIEGIVREGIEISKGILEEEIGKDKNSFLVKAKESGMEEDILEEIEKIFNMENLEDMWYNGYRRIDINHYIKNNFSVPLSINQHYYIENFIYDFFSKSFVVGENRKSTPYLFEYVNSGKEMLNRLSKLTDPHDIDSVLRVTSDYQDIIHLEFVDEDADDDEEEDRIVYAK